VGDRVQRGERDQPGPARLQHGGQHLPVQDVVLDQDLAVEEPSQGRRRQGGAAGGGGGAARPGGPADAVLDRRLPGEQVRGLGAGLPPRGQQVGVHGPQRAQVLLDALGGRWVGEGQRGRPRPLHPAEDAGRRVALHQ
jgi:hypothetical protein